MKTIEVDLIEVINTDKKSLGFFADSVVALKSMSSLSGPLIYRSIKHTYTVFETVEEFKDSCSENKSQKG